MAFYLANVCGLAVKKTSGESGEGEQPLTNYNFSASSQLTPVCLSVHMTAADTTPSHSSTGYSLRKSWTKETHSWGETGDYCQSGMGFLSREDLQYKVETTQMVRARWSSVSDDTSCNFTISLLSSSDLVWLRLAEQVSGPWWCNWWQCRDTEETEEYGSGWGRNNLVAEVNGPRQRLSSSGTRHVLLWPTRGTESALRERKLVNSILPSDFAWLLNNCTVRNNKETICLCQQSLTTGGGMRWGLNSSSCFIEMIESGVARINQEEIFSSRGRIFNWSGCAGCGVK